MSELPQHVFIIPDGNRRWARKHGKLLLEGHQDGAETFKIILSEALRIKIQYGTFWAMSKGNVLYRSKAEVHFLFDLLERTFREIAENKEVHENRVRIRCLGRWRDYCPPSLCEAIEYCLEKTNNYDGLNLTTLLCYSGKDEMTEAVRAVAARAGILPERIEEEWIKDALWTRDLPPVDLVIRTGGEPHWSEGAMMWDIAEARFYFTETLWPEFSPEEFRAAVEWYGKQGKRRGG